MRGNHPELWKSRVVSEPTLLQKRILLALVVTGICCVLHFADWWFREVHIANLSLYLILSMILWWGILRMVVLWISYLGFTMAWHVFYEDKRNETFTGEDGTLSIHGTQFRYLNAMPLHLTAQYYFNETENPIQPFVSLGAGTTYFNQRTDMGMYSAIRNNWQFSIQPEVGVSISNGIGNSIFLAAKYINSFKTDSYDGQSYLSFNIGVTWDFIGY